MVEVPGGVTVKKFVVGAVIGVALATAEHALAADAMPTKAPPAQSAYDWTGFYAGAHFGYAAGSSRWSATSTGVAAPALSGSLDLFNGFDMFKGTGSYFAGFQGGYNYLLPSRLLLGVEADISFPNTFGGMATFVSPATSTASYAELVEMSGTLRGRIGYARNLVHGPSNWLFYATGGFAWSYDQFTRAQIAGVPVGGTVAPGTAENLFMVPRLGGAAGVGVELGLTPSWAAGSNISIPTMARAAWHFPAAPNSSRRTSPCSRFVSASIISLATTVSIPGYSLMDLRRSTSAGSFCTGRRPSSSNTLLRFARPITAGTVSFECRA